MAPYLHWPSNVVPLLIPALIFILRGTDAGEVFLEEPESASVIIGQPLSFRCRVKPDLVQKVPAADKHAIWYQIKSGAGSGAEAISHSDEGRFFITGMADNGVFDLYINYTRMSDLGTSYLCVFNKTASMHAYLHLLPENWKPTCLSFPNTGIMVGTEIEIICASDGDKRTQLIWQRNGAIIDGTRTVVDDSVSLTYTERVEREETVTFTCSATLVDKQESEICSIGPMQVLASPGGSSAYIPYIIVGLLSVVVSMLFLTLLVVVFRHRQCRMCQTEPPEPQTVLDMSQLQAGGPPPFFPIHSDDDSDKSDDGIGRSPPPDLIPTGPTVNTVSRNTQKAKAKSPKRAQSAKPQRIRQPEQPQPRQNNPDPSIEQRTGPNPNPPQSRTRPGTKVQKQRNRNGSQSQAKQNKNRPGSGVSRARPQTTQDRTVKPELRRTSSNATLQENIDDREKDKTVTGKTKFSMANLVKSSGNKASSQKHNSKQSRQSKSVKESRKRRKERDADAESLKQLNIDGPRIEPGGTRPSTSNEPGVSTNDISLDFDASTPSGRHKRNLNDLSDNTTSGSPVRQSPNLSGAAGTSNNDKIIYAELDFKKPVGLNIMPDVKL